MRISDWSSDVCSSDLPHLAEAELAAQVRLTLQDVIDSEQTPLSLADRTRIAQDVSDDMLGHGPLEPFLRDQDVTERNSVGWGKRVTVRVDLGGRSFIKKKQKKKSEDEKRNKRY